MELQEIREKLKEMYGGENKQITDGHYDPSLAVKCINGTFVGTKTENITVFRGIASRARAGKSQSSLPKATEQPLR